MASEVRRFGAAAVFPSTLVVLASDYDALAAENARLRAELAAVREQQAIARRAADRIVQLCTTPHESKERFIRRVQSVIEWERAAQQDQPQ